VQLESLVEGKLLFPFVDFRFRLCFTAGRGSKNWKMFKENFFFDRFNLNKFLTNVDVKLFLNNHVEKMLLFYDETLILALVQEFHITKIINKK
jgi:hypothetical protein